MDILQFFAYKHLPPHLQAVSKPFCELAHAMVLGDNAPEAGTVTLGNPLPDSPQRDVALQRLFVPKVKINPLSKKPLGGGTGEKPAIVPSNAGA